MDTLVAADQHETMYRPDGLRAMAVSEAGLGLEKGCQQRVVASVGSYVAIFERTVGAKSPFKLDPQFNAPAGTGGLLVFPHLD